MEDFSDDGILPGITEGEIVVVRSARRKKNISAYRQGGRIVISIPARMSKADEREMVPQMIAKIRAMEDAKIPSEERMVARIDEARSHEDDTSDLPWPRGQLSQRSCEGGFTKAGARSHATAGVPAPRVERSRHRWSGIIGAFSGKYDPADIAGPQSQQSRRCGSGVVGADPRIHDDVDIAGAQ